MVRVVLINKIDGGIVSILLITIEEDMVNGDMVCTTPLNLTFDHPPLLPPQLGM
jgi:hypothetical protein